MNSTVQDWRDEMVARHRRATEAERARAATVSATVEREYMPALACAPWCTNGDGHPHEVFRADQWCGSVETMVEPLVSDYRYSRPVARALGLPPNYAISDGYGVSARRRPGHLDEVVLHHVGPDTETSLTPDEARRLAVALVATADLIAGVS